MSDFASRIWESIKQERFLVQDPEQLWAMVESADGPTVSGLGDLLTDAAKTIKKIGADLLNHSLAVEWEGEGGEAFRTWCHQAALTTLSLGDYGENAGKWLGHAANTLHEVKPQLELLRNQSVSARSVLDAHAAKATDVGSHDGGPSDSAVPKAKTQFANTRAEAGALMMKLAQSYTASTEQIHAVEAPKFPELPKRFVPDWVSGETHVSAPTAGGRTYPGTTTRAEIPEQQPTAGPGMSESNRVPKSSAPRHLTAPPHLTDLADVSDSSPRPHTDRTNTAIDSVEILPSSPVPASLSSPPVAPSDPDARLPSTTGMFPRAFGAGKTLPPGFRGGGERLPVNDGRIPRAMPSGPGTSTNPRPPGRAFSGPFGPGETGGQYGTGRGPVGSPSAEASRGVTGGRPVSPAAGRPTNAIPRGNVIGGTPNQQQPLRGRSAVSGRPVAGATPARGENSSVEREGAARGRMPAPSNGIVGGQPKPSRGRGRAGFTPRDVRAGEGTSVGEQPPRRGGPSRGASTASKRDDHSARDKRSGSGATDRAEYREHEAEDRDQLVEAKDNRPKPPPLPKGPDGDIGREA
ncbi:hypothetical protein [Streptomyces sp. SID161]|uniref:hypothetical protein n=1 Tax=Streptomyces sp. SID161 TaxID=2690251 RepID=UPI0013699303|nr:hypothetical protein [Streptomyces sp. SID161]MYW16777.1 hypothetical protein [Streptomyces sp. SID2955]MYW46201.1 hypothetical protein [Streptomyces sp. SID161]